MSSRRDTLRYRGPYTYQRLRDARSQIRLLYLMPGRRGSPIVVDLRSVNVPVNRGLSYEALSYTWGKPENPIAVAVARGDYYRTVHVTRNCAEALDALRLRDRSRLLWIDALCINQKDEEEKSEQVTLMADIYRNAFRVTAWLGPALRDTQLAFDWIREVSTNLSLNPQTDELSQLSGDNRWMQQGGDALIDEDEVCALAKLLSHPWFERVWIWQEIRLGYSRAVLKCGKFEVAWSAFCVAQKYRQDKIGRCPCYKTLVSRSVAYVRPLRDMRTPSVLGLLHDMRSSSCTDRRDRMFALHSMVDVDSQTILGKPDYSKHWRAVYTGLCINLTTRRSDLGFLRFVTEHVEHGLPSWVPDWRPSESLTTIYGQAGAFSRRAVVKIDDRMLRLKGQLVTTVRDVVSSTLRGEWTDSTRDSEHEALSRLLQSILTKLGLTIDSWDTTAVSYMLTLGEIQEARVPAKHGLPKVEDLVDAIQMLAVSPRVPARLQHVALRIASRCWGRSLLLMADGKIGLGPSHTRAGDLISVLLACHPAMVLRPSVDSEYRVVGPAYVSGLMEGQAFLGPLPSRYNFVWHQTKEFSCPAFQDRSSGTIRLTDPRLPELLGGWQYVGNSDDPEGWAFQNSRTGETRNHFDDPRWDVEALEARGIKLDTITLV